ncbi:MAG TPA: hypothetical protein VMI52_11135 [Acetobacteraceae bacterium]|nr:hypothetical protein [Acetobacteraceae bacterium]
MMDRLHPAARALIWFWCLVLVVTATGVEALRIMGAPPGSVSGEGVSAAAVPPEAAAAPALALSAPAVPLPAPVAPAPAAPVPAAQPAVTPVQEAVVPGGVPPPARPLSAPVASPAPPPARPTRVKAQVGKRGGHRRSSEEALGGDRITDRGPAEAPPSARSDVYTVGGYDSFAGDWPAPGTQSTSRAP